MRNLCLALGIVSLGLPLQATAQDVALLEGLLRARIAQDSAIVAVVYRDPARRDFVAIEPDRRFHAASTMKLPVLLELARRVDAQELGWNTGLTVRNQFRSIVDGSFFQLNPGDDSDSTLYLAEGQKVTVAHLARLMIVRSSNLATNILIQWLDARTVNATAHRLGADSIAVLRGVEDGKAFERGMNNTTTARDLAVLLSAVAQSRASSRAGSDSIRAMLLAQEFNGGIPAGLPLGTPVAHKTGWITATAHDAAIIYPPGRVPYVLVILTSGYPDEASASRLMADLSGLVWRWAIGKAEARE